MQFAVLLLCSRKIIMFFRFFYLVCWVLTLFATDVCMRLKCSFGLKTTHARTPFLNVDTICTGIEKENFVVLNM